MIAEPKPASTVVLIRRGAAGVEVFLVRRHDSIAFMGGAHVFPGGRVDAADAAFPLDRIQGVEAIVERFAGVSRAEARAHVVAAIRELFEEAGILLARDRRGNVVPLADGRDFDDDREQLADGRITLDAFARREHLRLAGDRLAVIAHWVTPAIETRRFDTYFFLAIAPDVQQAAHDGREAMHGLWISPSDALARCLAGQIALPPPTWTTLRWLERAETVDAAWERAQSCPLPRVEPCFREQDDGMRIIMLPGDPECPAIEGFEATERRFVLEQGRWRAVG